MLAFDVQADIDQLKKNASKSHLERLDGIELAQAAMKRQLKRIEERLFKDDE